MESGQLCIPVGLPRLLLRAVWGYSQLLEKPFQLEFRFVKVLKSAVVHLRLRHLRRVFAQVRILFVRLPHRWEKRASSPNISAVI
jgi:hypothetical protein